MSTVLPKTSVFHHRLTSGTHTWGDWCPVLQNVNTLLIILSFLLWIFSSFWAYSSPQFLEHRPIPKPPEEPPTTIGIYPAENRFASIAASRPPKRPRWPGLWGIRPPSGQCRRPEIWALPRRKSARPIRVDPGTLRSRSKTPNSPGLVCSDSISP